MRARPWTACRRDLFSSGFWPVRFVFEVFVQGYVIRRCLGLGEKPVAVTFNELMLLKGDDELFIYIDANQEEPEYES